MEVKIPQEQWGAMIGAAVLQSVTDENRDTLIKEALTHLLTPKDSVYGRGGNRTPLQEAFDSAVKEEAKKEVSRQLKDTLAVKVEAVVSEALSKAFSDDRKEKLIENIADAIIKAFRIDGY